MSSTPRTPSLRRHKPSAQAVVTLDGKDHYLGPWPAACRKAPPDARPPTTASSRTALQRPTPAVRTGRGAGRLRERPDPRLLPPCRAALPAGGRHDDE